jgi:ParB family chromosome partitioning protein
MAESIESMRRQRVEVVEIPTDRIEPDSVNPNEMADSLLEALTEDIREKGFVQPVLVRPSGDTYLIVDGEHRWRVLKDLGVETVPCVIDDRNEDDARLRMVSMNRLRGKFVPTKLAGVLADLSDEMGEEMLTEVLGMDDGEMTEVMAAPNPAEQVEEHPVEEAAQPVVLRWRMNPESAERVEAALEARQVAGAATRADALIELLAAETVRAET